MRNLAVGAVILSIFAVAACGSSTSGTGGGTTTTSSKTTTTTTKSTTTTTKSTTTTTTKTTATCESASNGAQCAELCADTCGDCCDTVYPQGIETWVSIFMDKCLCSATAPCKTQCAASICAATPTNPDAACQACYQGLANDAACLAATSTACQADAQCKLNDDCWLGCP